MTLTVMFMEKNESSVKPNGCNLMKEACLIEPANWMTWLDGVDGSLEESKVRSLIPTNTNVNVKKQVDRSWRCLLLNIGIDRELAELRWVSTCTDWWGSSGRSLQKQKNHFMR